MTKDYLDTSDRSITPAGSAISKDKVNSSDMKKIPWIDIYFVMSLDGVVAIDHTHDIRSFSSREDREFFLNSIRDYDGIIVSSRTYVKDASPGTRRVILTHSAPAEGASDPLGIYMSGDEREICEKMWDMGFKKAALAAGPSTCLSFLRAGLVKDLYLSIEPISLGSGIRLFTDENYISRWTLIESKKLNENGTMMMHYRNIDADPDHYYNSDEQ